MDFAVVQLGPIFQDELVLRRGTLEFIGKPFEDYLVDPLLLAEWFVVCPICLLVLSALWLVSESLMRQARSHGTHAVPNTLACRTNGKRSDFG